MFSIASRASGAAVKMLWAGTIFLALVAIAGFLPLKTLGLSCITDDVRASATFRILDNSLKALNLVPQFLTKSPAAAMPQETAAAPAQMLRDDEIIELRQDPAIQEILSDPELMDAIQKKDLTRVLSSPAVLKLAQNPGLMTKMLKLYAETNTLTAP